jgi:GTPase SAR1 family protein
LTKKETFDHAEKWLTDIKEEAGSDITIILLGNKHDVVEKNNELR